MSVSGKQEKTKGKNRGQIPVFTYIPVNGWRIPVQRVWSGRVVAGSGGDSRAGMPV